MDGVNSRPERNSSTFGTAPQLLINPAGSRRYRSPCLPIAPDFMSLADGGACARDLATLVGWELANGWIAEHARNGIPRSNDRRFAR